MRRVRSKDTRPEIVVRKFLYSLGYRYRLHRKDLPGTPDIVFPNRKKIIFVHGCFWHGHRCKRGARHPKSNVGYWKLKISRNVKRDESAIRKLKASGWDVLVLWECQISRTETLRGKLKKFLN